MSKMLFPIIGLILLAGCGTANRTSYSSTPSEVQKDKPEVITKSLFESRDQTISEENIQRLLNGTTTFPDTVRVAVYKHGSTSINRYYANWWNNEEYLRTQQSFMDTITKQISQAARVRKVIAVPALMTGGNVNITQLRETAVRLKADILVVFSVSSDIYYKYRLFKKSEAKAYATCEAILMDVRTGLIPHTSIITDQKNVRKTDEDFGDAETLRNAEREAINLTLAETGRQLSGYLSGTTVW